MVAPGLLPPAPMRSALSQQDGTFAQVWKNWFAQLYDKIGGVGSSDFLPIFTTTATVGTPVYSTQRGRFTTIGTLRIAEFDLALSDWTGAPTGNAAIGGFPQSFVFGASSGIIGAYAKIDLGNASFTQMGLLGAQNQTYALLYGMGSGAGVTGAPIAVANVSTTASISGTVIYSV